MKFSEAADKKSPLTLARPLTERRKVPELDPKHEKSILKIEKAKRKMEGIMDTK